MTDHTEPAAPAPATPPTRPPLAPPPGTPFSFEAAAALGWKTFTRSYWSLVFASLLIMLASLGVMSLERIAIEAIAPSEAEEPTVVSTAVSVVVQMLIMWPLEAACVGVAIAAIAGVRSRRAVFRHASSQYLNLVGTGLAIIVVLGVSVAAAFVIAAGSSHLASAIDPYDSTELMLILLIVAVIIGLFGVFYTMCRISLAMLFLVDERSGVRSVGAAIHASFAATNTRWLTLGIVFFAYTVIATVSVVLLVLPGLFFGMPLMLATIGAAYHLLAREREARSSASDVTTAPATLTSPPQ